MRTKAEGDQSGRHLRSDGQNSNDQPRVSVLFVRTWGSN